MSTRLLKESICDSKTIARLEEGGVGMAFFAEVLFCRVMVMKDGCDDFGRFEADAELVRARAFPRLLHLVTVGMVQEGLALLERVGLVATYTGPDGKTYGCYLKWSNHQRIRNKRAKFPPPPIDNLIPDEGTRGEGRGTGESDPVKAERVLRTVRWFYDAQFKITGERSSNFDGSHVHPMDREAALKYFRMVESGQWTREDFQRRVVKALRHEYTKNIPSTFAVAVACRDDYRKQHEVQQRGVRREERGAGVEYAEVEPRGMAGPESSESRIQSPELAE
jgi:hypothetical protein